ncbi:Fic family protein [Spiribacter vilamensis]|uniref:Fic family protein n=1 Tax=Spiribacter vilamensis TaxID=531306 RepID=A0A4Q8D0A6_9GAMM|nr:Fic family protein [Spiribacter vilamensis]
MEGLGFELRREASLETLTTDVVTSSSIEGENLNPREVRSSIARWLGIDIGGYVPAGRNVEGTVEMMLDATRSFDSPLTTERLFDWHAALSPTGRTGIQRITVADWRPDSAGPMQVVSGPVGKERVHYEAPAADRIDVEIGRFLDWFEAPDDTDPVLRAGIAHFWFVTLHPFEDGNGRIARAITDMALARADGMRDRFYSMSAQIETERGHYYARLERQQRGSTDLTEWLAWFLDCLGRALESAESTSMAVLYKAQIWEMANDGPVSERQRLVLNRMLDAGFEGFMNTSKYARLAKCSTDTALRDIRGLVERGLLLPNPGGGRSTSYRLPTSGEIRSRLGGRE